MLARLAGRLGVKEDETTAAAWAFACFFCLMAAYYVLRPLRDAMGLLGGTRDLPRLFLVTLAVTLAVTPAYFALVSRVPRRRFLPVVYRVVAATLLGFAPLVAGPHPSVLAARAFFVWTSVFNLFALTILWGFMADLFRHEQATRLFGLFGAGATLGALAGSLVTASLVERAGTWPLLVLSAVLIEGAVQCVRRLAALFHVDESAPREGLVETRGLRTIAHVLATPYLLAIAGYVLLFTSVSTFAYLEQARIARASLPDTASRAALFATIDAWVNGLSLALQILATGPLVRALGVTRALSVLPAFCLAGFVALGWRPTLGMLVAFQVARRTVDYAIAKPTREVLFTVVSREDKYKAKAFLDTFVYRGGDGMAAALFEAVAPALGGSAIALAVPTCAAWMGVAIVLGRAEERRARSSAST